MPEKKLKRIYEKRKPFHDYRGTVRTLGQTIISLTNTLSKVTGFILKIE